MMPSHQARTMTIKSLFLSVCFAGCALPSGLAQCSVAIGAADAGWYNAAGFHEPGNNNYYAGYSASSGAEFRDWFVFHVPTFSTPIVAASLRIFTFDLRLTNGAIFELHHVSTPLAALTNGGTGLTNIFEDLGDGPVFGAGTIFTNQDNSFAFIPLNSNALAAIAPGQRLTIGGRVTSFIPGSTNDHTLFGYSYNSPVNVQLVLALGSTNVPVLLSQTPTNYFTSSGATARLSVTACGAAPLSYRWFFNGALIPGPSGTLTISNISATNEGNYFVIVSNSSGSITSTVTHVFVDSLPPAIDSLSYASEIPIDGTLAIYASVQGWPSPALQWFFNGAPLGDATNSALLIASAQSGNSGLYTITASNAYGIIARDVRIDVLPFVLYGPFDGTIDLGADTFLSSAVDTRLAPSFQWRFFGTNIPGATAAVLPLFNASLADTGPYSVVVSVPGYARTSSVAQVIVTGAAPRLVWPPNDIATEGSSYVLEHDVSGSPPINLQWYLNATRIPDATNAWLLFDPISSTSAGNYTLVASNAFGVATHSCSVVVAPLPPTVQPRTPSRLAYVGDNIALEVAVTGTLPSRLRWSFNGADLLNATNSVLLLTNVTLVQSGTYTCRGTNVYGTNAAQISLSVLPRHALDRWIMRNPLPQPNDLEHIAFFSGRYVAVGEGGIIVTSTNAVDWMPTMLGNRYNAIGLASGNGRFVLLAHDGASYLVFISLDGVNWTARAVPGFVYATGIAFAAGEFQIWGTTDFRTTLRTRSSDGTTWNSEVAPQLPVPSAVTYGNGLYIAAASSTIFVGSDGVHFTARPAPGYGFNRVRFANGLFVAVGFVGTLFTSTDAEDWQPHDSHTRARLDGVAYGNGRFVVVGEDGAILNSTDNGASWNAGSAGVTPNLKDVIFDGARFVAGGNDGVLLTSPDGITWVNHRRGITEDLYGIIYTNGLFVAVGYDGTILTSGNGVSWTSQTAPNSRDLHAITYAGGQFVVVGKKGAVLTSPDAVHWNNRPTPTTNYLQRVAYGNGRYVAVGSAGTILSSTTGILWQSHSNPAPSAAELEGVAFGHGNTFVVVGSFETGAKHTLMLASTNGIDWTNVSHDIGKALRGVVWASDRFQAVGNDGATVFSKTGFYWDSQDSVEFVPPFGNLRQVTYAAGRFVAVGNDGTIISQPSGWTPHASIVIDNLHDIAFGNGKFVAVGNAGTIVQSDVALPVFSSPALNQGKVEFSLRGGLEDTYALQFTDSFTNWATVGTFTNTGTAVPFSLTPLTGITNFNSRFFRVLYP
jgi:photosystem II stability/assembly factor-like uncharacterized protein